MGVITIVRLQVEPTNLERLWKERAADFEAVMAEAKAAGATSHRWGFGDGEVIGIDLWPDAASFQSFFGLNTRIPELLQAAGVQGPPDVKIFEAPDAPDVF